MPTKEEIKAQYGIDNDDFEILTEFPTHEQLQERQSILIYAGEFMGAPSWLWKTFGGCVLAVILIVSNAVGHWNNLKPIARYAAEALHSYWTTIDLSKEPKGSAIFFPPDAALANNIEEPPPNTFPLHTIVAPISGSWHV